VQQAARLLKRAYFATAIGGSARYWQRRYSHGGTSGDGSYGVLAHYKARYLNDFVQRNGIGSVIELGCGDGNQLSLANYPRYLGIDVAQNAIRRCADRFAEDESKSFLWLDPAYAVRIEAFVSADLALSLDIVYHLVEDDVYRSHLTTLFACARRYVIVYSSNDDEPVRTPHVRHRCFVPDALGLAPAFRLALESPNPHSDLSRARFFVFERCH
jgi:SAM-dependent methyltransferase